VGSTPLRPGSEAVPVGPHNPDCYVCGTRNPAAQALSLSLVDDRVVGDVTLTAAHQGAPGLAHGGAVSALFDEALGVVVHATGVPAVTARLEVNYRRPFVLGRRHLVEARIERREGRKFYTEGTVHDEQGTLVADASGLFVQVPVEHFLENLPPEWRDNHGDAESQLPW
jgi:uncharacterized protein (TIGR00369 family)